MRSFSFFFLGALLSGAAVAADPQKPKNDYNITLNYEPGMPCTGFDFS